MKMTRSRKAPLQIFDSWRRLDPVAADFHMHTTWTDGTASVVDMYEAAVAAGLNSVLFSEHARATSGDWFPKFAGEVRSLHDKGCSAFVGAEVKVLNFEGELDISQDVRRECSLIMASVHRFPGETRMLKGKDAGYTEQEAIDIEFELARAALRAGDFDILGHPFGMAYRRFGFNPPEAMIRELMRDCARADIAFEINARYHSDPELFLTWCREEGAPISLGSNAHSPVEVGQLQRILRRGAQT